MRDALVIARQHNGFTLSTAMPDMLTAHNTSKARTALFSVSCDVGLSTGSASIAAAATVPLLMCSLLQKMGVCNQCLPRHRRSHIESLIAAAAAQQVQSELAVRVSGWRARIDPILAAEEDRSAFDIHDYGTKILDRLVDVTETKEQEQQQQQQQSDAAENVDFKQVAAAQDSFEVCRLFAAMLQLVNNRSVCQASNVNSSHAQ